MAPFIAAWFNALVCIGIPLGVLVYCLLRRRRLVLCWVAGLLTFLVSQVLVRIPLLGALGGQLWFVRFSVGAPVGYAVFLGLTAGLFEEGGRLWAISLAKKHRGHAAAVAFGVGHGGLEAMLVGVNNLVIIFRMPQSIAGTSPMYVAAAGVERLFAMMLHVGLSVMVMKGVEAKKPLWVALAVLVHGAVDTLVVLMQQWGAGIWPIEGVVALFGLAALAYAIFTRPKGAGSEQLAGGQPAGPVQAALRPPPDATRKDG